MSTCLQCAHIDLRSKPRHTKSGWAPCPKQSCDGLSMMVMIQRERVCPHFNDAPAEIVAVRNSPARVAERRRKQAAKETRRTVKLREKFGG